MNKNKLKLKWILGIYKVLPSYPSQEDFLFEITEFHYQKDSLNDSFGKNVFKLIMGTKKFYEFETKVDEFLEYAIANNFIKKSETKNKETYIIVKENIPYLN